MLTLGSIAVRLVEANGASDFVSLISAITMRWQKCRKHNLPEQEQVRTCTHWMLTHN